MAYGMWHMSYSAESTSGCPTARASSDPVPSAIRTDDQDRFANMDPTSSSLGYDRVRPGDPDERPGPGNDILHVRESQNDISFEFQFQLWRIIASSASVPAAGRCQSRRGLPNKIACPRLAAADVPRLGGDLHPQAGATAIATSLHTPNASPSGGGPGVVLDLAQVPDHAPGPDKNPPH